MISGTLMTALPVVFVFSVLIAFIEKSNYDSYERNPFKEGSYVWVMPCTIAWKKKGIGWAISFILLILLIALYFFTSESALQAVFPAFVVVVFLVIFLIVMYFGLKLRKGSTSRNSKRGQLAHSVNPAKVFGRFNKILKQ
ncbi:MAG: hypothetical protein AABX14_03925 [Candidatus Aenigmatarchaeota archaeon]